MCPPPKQPSTPETRRKATQLLSRYGALLTDRQQHFAHQHLVLSRSFADIAREAGVSRQAVHDAVRKATKILQDVDCKISKKSTVTDESVPTTDPASRLEALRKRIASQGIIYSSDWIVRELAEIHRLISADDSK